VRLSTIVLNPCVEPGIFGCLDAAAWMVQRHGANAFKAIKSKLEKMRRDGVDEDHVRRWCWVARAVIEIIREPNDAEAVH
jgi:hypothetical protein